MTHSSTIKKHKQKYPQFRGYLYIQSEHTFFNFSITKYVHVYDMYERMIGVVVIRELRDFNEKT